MRPEFLQILLLRVFGWQQLPRTRQQWSRDRHIYVLATHTRPDATKKLLTGVNRQREVEASSQSVDFPNPKG